MLSSDFSEVINLADRVRYTYDIKESSLSVVDELDDTSNELKSHLYSNELLISKDVTPDLYAAIERVSERLNFPVSSISAFVYATPEINAFCVQGGGYGCVLRFSSGLIDILNADEFEFVVGHELGHFLFEHLGSSMLHNDMDLERLIKLRSQELSADRIGLLGCKSLDVAIRSILKTVSGLNDKHLRFDASKYISQLNQVSDDSMSNIEMTHPSMLVRCRALLWFSISHIYLDVNDYNSNDIETLDNRVKLDMDRYVDSSSIAIIENTKKSVALWKAAHNIIQKDKFTKSEQALFEKNFGRDSLKNLIRIVSELDKSEADNLIYDEFKKYRGMLEKLIPTTFESEMLKLDCN